MKIKLLFYVLGIVLLAGLNNATKAQPADSLKTALGVKPLPDTLNNRISRLEAANNTLSGKVDSLHKSDSAVASAIRSSFSEALANWKKNSKEYYAHTSGHFGLILFLLLLIMALIIILLAKKTALCRDQSFDPNTHELKKDIRKRPFSYSRVQCLWWTFIIVACYAAVCFHFYDLLPLNSTIIILLGGGLSVGVFGTLIDTNQIQEIGGSHMRHQDVYDSKGFFTDILSDDNGISVYRLQAVLFNIIFGVGFLMTCIGNVENVANHAYPFIDFEMWQFALLGISAAGYLGLKTTENGKGTQQDRADAGGVKLAPPVKNEGPGSKNTPGQ